MKLTSVEIEERATGWSLEPVTFENDLTLLVGISGVGKSKILRSISRLVQLARGFSRDRHYFWGWRWRVQFMLEDNQLYTWDGQFEDEADDTQVEAPREATNELGEDESVLPRISRESLSVDGKCIVNRSADEIILNDAKMPKLSRHLSVLHLLAQENLLQQPQRAWQRVLFLSHAYQQSTAVGISAHSVAKFVKQINTEQELREASTGTPTKMVVAFQKFPDLFQQIVGDFMEVFPYVANVAFELSSPRNVESYFLRIRERGMESWIGDEDISSGMKITLSHLARMYLWPEGTVTLIDEFETSLGVNCIDVVVDQLLESKKRQYILASHHPYIINNIDPKYWKIVHRSGSVVRTKNATDLGIGKSRHQAFVQLLNSEGYCKGIEQQ